MTELRRKIRKAKDVPPDIPNIFEAAATNDIEGLKVALEYFDIDEPDSETQMTPIHFAVAYGATEAAKILIERDANLCLLDKFDRTPLRLMNEVHGYDGTLYPELRAILTEHTLDLDNT